MKELSVFNKRDQLFLGKVVIADNFLTRMKGLLGSTNLASFRGILLKPCQQVHTIGMRYPLSIWYINRELKVIKIIDELPPNTVSPFVKDSYIIIEFPSTWAGITGSREGDSLEVLI